ncbi:MAG: hypothetical protein HQM10_17095 [Candidatus Riflebacteria bacterium]|nr:hypothetical protein [Candidatus Riflebacteria bacterium]
MALKLTFAGKFKFLIWITTVSGISVCCLAFLIFAFFSMRAQTYEEKVSIGEIIADNLSAAVAFDDAASALKILKSMKADSEIALASLKLVSGETFADYVSEQGASEAVKLRSIALSDNIFHPNHISLKNKVSFEGKTLGTLYIVSSLDPIWNILRQYILVCILCLFISSVVLHFLSSLMLKKLIQPIIVLARAASDISTSKDYSIRAEIENTDDEISLLKNCFFEMLDQIQKEIAIRKKTEDEIKHAKELAETFSYSVSHDLRAPLRAIEGYTNVILEDFQDKLEPELRENFNRIIAGCGRMNSLIEALLSLSRIERTQVKSEEVNISAMIKEIDSGLRWIYPDRKVEFSFVANAKVKADPQLLKVALENLIGNSWKYSSKVEIAKIEFGINCVDNKKIFFIKDNGAGFDMAYSNKLFGAFQRLHSPREFEGTGIGLATVNRIFERHGGKIWAEGAIGKGATFYFTLPESMD